MDELMCVFELRAVIERFSLNICRYPLPLATVGPISFSLSPFSMVAVFTPTMSFQPELSWVKTMYIYYRDWT